MKLRMLIVALCLLFLVSLIISAFVFTTGVESFMILPTPPSLGSTNRKLSPPLRKLLVHTGVKAEPNRLPGDRCTKSDIVINQSPSIPLASGIPTYTVDITNMCFTGCDISRIRVACGWFSSDQLIDPKTFKRLKYNTCLVNNGRALPYGATLSFQYANSHPYPLSIYSLTCS